MSETAAGKARAAARAMYSHQKVRDRNDADLLVAGFTDGAEWQAARKVEVTTDEREALIGIMREARNPDGHAVLRYEDAADAILSAGFRRGSHEAHR